MSSRRRRPSHLALPVSLSTPLLAAQLLPSSQRRSTSAHLHTQSSSGRSSLAQDGSSDFHRSSSFSGRDHPTRSLVRRPRHTCRLLSGQLQLPRDRVRDAVCGHGGGRVGATSATVRRCGEPLSLQYYDRRNSLSSITLHTLVLKSYVRSPRIDHLLSLSRIRTFTFVADSYQTDTVPAISPRRQGPLSLKVDTLIVRVVRGLRVDSHRPLIEQSLHRILFRHFDPRFLEFIPLDPGSGEITNLLETHQPMWHRFEGVRLVQSCISPRLPPGPAQWSISCAARGGTERRSSLPNRLHRLSTLKASINPQRSSRSW